MTDRIVKTEGVDINKEPGKIRVGPGIKIDPNLEAAGRRWCPRCQAMVNTIARVQQRDVDIIDCFVCGSTLQTQTAN